MFEEHDDGRLGARIHTYTLEPTGLHGWHLFLDTDGGLVQSPISYMDTADSVRGAGTVVATKPYDADFETPLPDAAIGGT